MRNQLNSLESEFKSSLNEASTFEQIDALRLTFFGKKGKLTSILKGLGKVSGDERAELGKTANQLKQDCEKALENKREEIQAAYYDSLAESEYFDVTSLPLAKNLTFGNVTRGHTHSISQMQQKLESIFESMGFSIIDGPQVETDFYNFEALNFTEDHPAREMQDTFYMTNGSLLRTHTSAVQIRGLKKLKPPLRMIAPGRVFRYEEIDASHEHTFYQMEGMVIAKEVSISHLLFLMKTLLTQVFDGQEPEIRLRPGYFPFVEPGFELDMKCLICSGDGCSVCKKTGWVEVLPCGLVHPNVLKSAGLDPEQWQGAAFGLGLNRLVMMQHGIEDIRHFQDANPAFLSQF